MNIEKLVRKNILELKPYTAARHSHHNGILLDANENSFGSTLKDNVPDSINRYPDPYQKDLRDTVSRLYDVPGKNLFFGVGSDEIIDLLIRIFCIPTKDNVIVCESTYGMYKVACDINDIEVRNAPLNSEFNIDMGAIEKSVDINSKLLFLCSPNNPTANLLDEKLILDLTQKMNLIVVVDEAYIDFSGSKGLLSRINEFPNLVVMRTFSKAWGLAGVRCGYCSASDQIIDLLFKVKAPYNISKLTSDTICKAAVNVETRDDHINLIMSEKSKVSAELSKRPKVLNVLPSNANFISFKVDKPKEVYNYLEKGGIIIRDRSGQFNFTGYLRVTIGTEKENELFLQKLDEIL